LLQLRADLAVLARARGELGARERQLRPRLGIVERARTAPSCTSHAFFDQDLGDFPGDLGPRRWPAGAR